MQISTRTLPLIFFLRRTRQLIPIRGWDRAFRVIFPPGKQKSFCFELEVPGGILYANAASHLDRYALLHGSIEPDELEFARLILATIKARTVLDVGANVGHFSVAMAEFCQTVHAFEPNPDVHERLIRNVTANKHNIRCYPFGLSETNSTLPFQSVRAEHDGQGNFSSSGNLLLTVKRGDDLGLTDIDFIKIDVEGHDSEVLRGLARTIEIDRPAVLCECCKPPNLYFPPDYQFFLFENRAISLRKKLVQLRQFTEGDNIFCLPPELTGRFGIH